MIALRNSIESVRQQFGSSARLYVDGFPLDERGECETAPWPAPANSWFSRRLQEVRRHRQLWDDLERIRGLR